MEFFVAIVCLLVTVSASDKDDGAGLHSDVIANLCEDKQFNFISQYLTYGKYGGEVVFEAGKQTPHQETALQANSIVCRCDIRASQNETLEKPFDVQLRWKNVNVSSNCARPHNQCEDMYKIVIESKYNGKTSSYIIDNWSDVDFILKREHSAGYVHTVRLEYIHYSDTMRSLLSSSMQIIANRRLYVKCGVDYGEAVGYSDKRFTPKTKIHIPNPSSYGAIEASPRQTYLRELIIVVAVICTLILLASVAICIMWKRRHHLANYGAHWRGQEDKSFAAGAESLEVQVGTLDNRPSPPLSKPKIGDDFTINFDPVAQSSRDDLTNVPGTSHEDKFFLQDSPTACKQDSLPRNASNIFIRAELNSSWTDSPELPPRLPPRRGSRHNSSFPGISPVFRPPPPSPRTKHLSWYYHSNGMHSNDSDSDDHLRRPLRPKRFDFSNSNAEGTNIPLVHFSRPKRPGTDSSDNEVKLPIKSRRKRSGSRPKTEHRLGPVGAESGCESGNESDSSNNSLLSDRFPSSDHHVLDSDVDDHVKPCDSISNHRKHEQEDEYLGIWHFQEENSPS